MNNTMNNINVNNSINNNNDPFKTFTAVQDRDTIPIQIIEAHLGPINHISVFPNGTFISVSDDCSIKLFDKDCLLISTLENAHENSIQYISIKNNYEFVTCSDDRSLKIWHLNNNIIELYKEIKNAHIQAISCVIYTSLGNIISCSIDKFIKIRFGNFYEKVTVLVNTDTVAVFSLLEIDNDILVSGGWEGIKFWDLKKKMKINSINNCSVVNCDALARIDTDKIAVGGDKYGIIKIISISKKQIIMEINNFTQCLALMGIFYKGLFASGGEDCAIKLYSVENYDCVKEITRAHEGGVNGFCKIRNGILVSYGADGNIKVWNV
jgi:WD40 repeat protein